MFRLGLIFPGFILFAAVVRFAIIAAFILLIVKMFKKSGICKNDALRILDNKFANGEISEEEYRNRKSLLTH